MAEHKKEKPVRKMEFEKEKLALVKLRVRNKFYERSDVLEEVVTSILKKEVPSQGSTS